MRGIGIVRKVDHLGRIVLPKELRETMNISPDDGVEIFVKDDQIVLQKVNPSCVATPLQNSSILRARSFAVVVSRKHAVMWFNSGP